MSRRYCGVYLHVRVQGFVFNNFCRVCKTILFPLSGFTADPGVDRRDARVLRAENRRVDTVILRSRSAPFRDTVRRRRTLGPSRPGVFREYRELGRTQKYGLSTEQRNPSKTDYAVPTRVYTPTYKNHPCRRRGTRPVTCPGGRGGRGGRATGKRDDG